MRKKLSKCSNCGKWFWEYGHFFGICSPCMETVEEPLGKKLQYSKPKPHKSKSEELHAELDKEHELDKELDKQFNEALRIAAIRRTPWSRYN